MPKPISAANPAPVRVVIVTLDGHLGGALDRALPALKQDLPGLTLSLHAAAEWAEDPAALERCREDIAQGDIIFANMLFMEDHINAVLPALERRRADCDAMVGCMAAGEIIRLTRIGQFDMNAPSGAMALLKRLRGGMGKKKSGTAGSQQMAVLRRLPKILRFIPGTAQDLRAYFLTMQYWLAGSDKNLGNLVRFLVNRYAAGPRAALNGALEVELPEEYPDVGLYHPRIKKEISDQLKDLPRAGKRKTGTVGVLVMRSYALSGDTAHYDGVIAALEARGLRVIPAFAGGLDARPAVDQYFLRDGEPQIDALVSLTGFSLVGGPAYNDSKAAEDMLARLDVPYIAAHALELQTLDQWQSSDAGLLPVESTMMVAIPELDGAAGPLVFGGRVMRDADQRATSMQVDENRADALADRVLKLIALRRTQIAERKIGIVLFNFPPNGGSAGTAAFLSVFESLHRTLTALRASGYSVDVPDTVDALRQKVLGGNSDQFGTDANVLAQIAADDHVRREEWLAQIEGQWGPAPGKHQTDGSSIFVLGAQFGNVFVGLQPSFGYEGDPMRLLFEGGFTPTHAFSAFYRYLREDFGADAVLHFGTHGALEFMPGKQTGLSKDCWPDRLIGDLPNFYLYASNNPSEGTIAKRRSNATLISYLTPPVAEAGLHQTLATLKDSVDRWRGMPPGNRDERARLAELIQAQAAEIDLATAEPAWGDDAETEVPALADALFELETTLIPNGLHVVGQAISPEERVDLLVAAAAATHALEAPRDVVAAIVRGDTPEEALAASGIAADAELLAQYRELADRNELLSEDHEIPALLEALDGRFIRPVPGGDLIRSPDILPTGRNLHGFDPFRIPSAFAIAEGERHAALLLERHRLEANPLPESIALVLWGTDNLKTEGGPIAQALALIGARPRFDSFGRLSGADLIPLDDLGRPRIDVMVTLSGIFRDLLPLQTRMLAAASYQAASADEPVERNFVRKHALAYMAEHDCDLETAALRVFSNAEGAYGSNVNHLIDSGQWDDEDELAETYTRRKGFAYGCDGKPVQQTKLLNSVLADVQLTYQNLDSIETGITGLEHYFDTLGGISRAVHRAKGATVPMYIGDQTTGDSVVRTVGEQVALETRTRTLNPKWYEGMLDHGYEGVHQIEAHVTNTMGWSATTGQVPQWVYNQLTETFVLDDEMRNRLATLNPKASMKVANRLIEAHERNYWSPDAETLEALRKAGEALEDRLEGINEEVAA